MHKAGKFWSLTTYGVSDEVARIFNERRKGTRLSESSFLASIIESALLPAPNVRGDD